jgi:glycosyltransferase involved in cell wall biosynthesis
MNITSAHRPLRIMVVEPRGTGGMIHYAYQLCAAMSNAGAHVTLVTSTVYEMEEYPHPFALSKQMRLWSTIESQQTEPGTGWARSAGQSVFRKIRRGIRGIRLIVEWIRLVIYLIREKPDVVQFGAIEFAFEAVFLDILRRNGLTLSQICHEFELREQGNGLLVRFSNRLFRWVYDSFSVIFFHGESNRDRFLALFDVPMNRLQTIDHGNEGLFLAQKTTMTGAQLREQYGIESDAPVVLFFGNLMPSKGVPDLLKAFAKVHAKDHRARLVVAGNPSKFIDMNELKQLAVKLNIGMATIFDARYIPMEAVAALMDMTTVAVYPYLTSTQSGALQVAYSFARPVIATYVGGLPEVVEDGKSGFLVPPASPDELAGAILKILENPALAKEMGAYAKYLSDTRFSWDAIAKKMLGIYISALDGKS